jgi:predicted TIM-barrel enzyme
MGKFGKLENSLRVVHNRFSVGAAVGSGMAARAAEKAGADFILALGAGKMRSMGVPSPASLLPIYDAVELTLEFAALELVPRVQLPVYVGLPLFDPRLKIDDLLHRLRTLGISGITNFPAVFHFGKRACLLEAHGLGLDREIEFLTAGEVGRVCNDRLCSQPRRGHQNGWVRTYIALH